MKNFFDAETVVTAAKGAVGVSATSGGLYVSLLPKFEAWLRIISLVIGIAVGVATFISIVRSKSKNKNRKPTFRRFLDLIE
jgi:fructose-specific phosphotransferase system IIC component